MDGKVPPIWLGFLRYDAETKEGKDLPFLGLAVGDPKVHLHISIWFSTHPTPASVLLGPHRR